MFFMVLKLGLAHHLKNIVKAVTNIGHRESLWLKESESVRR